MIIRYIAANHIWVINKLYIISLTYMYFYQL